MKWFRRHHADDAWPITADVDTAALAERPCGAIHAHGPNCLPAGAVDDSATWPLPRTTLDLLADTPDLHPEHEFDDYLDALDFRDQLDVLAGQALRHALAADRAAERETHPTRHHRFTVLRGTSSEAYRIAHAAALDALDLTDQLTAWRTAHGIPTPAPEHTTERTS